MKNAPTTVSSESAPNKRDITAKLLKRIERRPPAGRILRALLARPYLWREEADRISGLSNSPCEIEALRSYGLSIPCRRVRVECLDGRATHAGQYSLSPDDRMAVIAALSQVKKGGAL